MAEENLSCCQSSSISHLRTQSTRSPHYDPTTATGNTLLLELYPDNGQASDFCCFNFYFLCCIHLASLSTILLKMGDSAQVSPPHLHLLSIFSYSRTQWCSHKTEVLSSHRTWTNFFHHHRPDSSCGKFLLPYEHGHV